jgi:hypothetical protein
MLLIDISLLLALVPLAGIGWILVSGTLFTVDGLFMSLILLTMSGIVGTTALFEVWQWRKGGGPSFSPSLAAGKASSGSGVERGVVESVEFYESGVGQPNKSIVKFQGKPPAAPFLVFEGDMRNALPVGQRVEVTFRRAAGYNVLVDVSYS